MSFIYEYRSKYKELLDVAINYQKRNCSSNLIQRGTGFEVIFTLLESLQKPQYNIVETGTIRNPNNWKEGNSGFLFQEFLKYHSGSLTSIDINEENCNISKNFLDESICNVVCGDSVNTLSTMDLSIIDLFYLDSYDVKWANDVPSAEHHLKEFKIIEPFLNQTVVAIDDNTFYNGVRSGKGRLIYEYLADKGIHPVYDEYIMIYFWK
jgi:hypothetical protein